MTTVRLCIYHMQNFDGVLDAKMDLIDNTILFSAMAENPTFSRIAAGGGFYLPSMPVR